MKDFPEPLREFCEVLSGLRMWNWFARVEAKHTRRNGFGVRFQIADGENAKSRSARLFTVFRSLGRPTKLIT